VATTKPVTVVLISPNHFSVGQARIITSSATWETPYGTLQPDLATIRALTEHNLVQVEEAPFDHEHGVTGVVAFIKKSLPNAKLIPLIVNDRLPLSKAMEVAERMQTILPQDVLVVGSFDFSHYLPSRAAQFHDELSLSAVRGYDYAAIARLDVDSRPGLALFLRMMETWSGSRFTLLDHANSAELTRVPDVLETTSYITGYFAPAESPMPAVSPVETALLLGRIEESPKVLAGLEVRSTHYAIEYLQRLLTGQQRTVAALSGLFTQQNRLVRLGLTDFVEQEQTFTVGSGTVTYMVADNPIRARELIDRGSNIVCIASDDVRVEEYNGGVIVRGLGNFLTQEVLALHRHVTVAVGVAVQAQEVRVYLFPVEYRKSKGKLLTGTADDTLLATIAAQSAVSTMLKEQIKTGVLNIKIR
jgi:AmmeMemoRadiSam system protein B